MPGVKRVDNKGRNLRIGEYQRANDGLYLYRYKDLSGKMVTIYAQTLVELREKEKTIERDLDDGIDLLTATKMTLNDLFDRYMKIKQLRISTKVNYIGTWNNLVRKEIGKMKLSEIKQIHIREFYNSLSEKNYAEKTIRLCHHMIFPALEIAVDSDLIRKNPAKGCQKHIRGSRKIRTALTVEEQQVLLDFVKESKVYNVYYPMIVFALSTGLRVGELTGLQWKNVDLKRNVVHIRQQLVYKNYGDGCRFHIEPLKTDAGWRDIPLTQNAKKALLKQKEIMWLLFGKMDKKEKLEGLEDLVFLNKHGSAYATNAVNFVLDGIVKAYNKVETKQAIREHREPMELPHISAHILRHTACSRFAESGLDPKTLQIIMGHSNVTTTLDVYTHLDFTKVKEKIKEIDDRIQSIE